MLIPFSFYYLFIFFCCYLPSLDAAMATRSRPPVIVSKSPTFGSTEGGTWLTITGVNFSPDGLFSTRLIYIGGQVCKEISYYTSDKQITCIVPKCVAETCLDNPNYRGSVTVSLDIYVSTVEGIYDTSSTFVYNGQYTNSIYQMSRYIRPTDAFSVYGYLTTTYLPDFSLYIGSNLAYLGDPGELNSEFFTFMGSNTIYYKPPADLQAGLYNLSLNAQNNQTNGNRGTGYARTYPLQRFDPNYDYPYGYLYDSYLSGEVYSVCLQPTITKISPQVGSIVGGTEVTIQGSGFSKEFDQLTVLVAGLPCDITSSDFEEIVCVTRSIDLTSFQVPSVDSSQAISTFSNSKTFNSSRNFGSASWDVRIWDYVDYTSNNMKASNVKLHLISNDINFGLYNKMGSSWPTAFDYSSRGWDSKIYAGDFMTYLLAPFSGYYEFYMTTDDLGYLYMTYPNQTEFLILSTTYTYPGYMYNDLSHHVSKKVYLSRGSRLRLRCRLVNSGGGADYVLLGLKLTPDTSASANYLPISEVTSDPSFQGLAVTPLQNISQTFLHHHSLKDIQIISLSIRYQYEVQTISIYNVDSGSFSIIVQNSVATTTLSFSSSTSEIASALAAASTSLGTYECNSYGVTKKLSSNGKNLLLTISFFVDNTSPLTLLDLYSGDLLGSNVTYSVYRQQYHSTLPTGSYSLGYHKENQTLKTSISYDADEKTLRTALQALDSHINVDVRRGGSLYSGYSWTVTFTNPRGIIPTMSINASSITADSINGTVTKAQNGSESSFWFETIPTWMTELPLNWSTNNKVNNNVEIFVQTSAGDALKASCNVDFSARANITDVTALGYLNDESLCGYDYTTDATPIVTHFSKYEIDPLNTGIEIFGNFLVSTNLTEAKIQVSIANFPCNLTAVNLTYIHCIVQSVPWGNHAPEVYVEGYGNALRTTTETLNFKQYIYSFYPQHGSLAGGQIINIYGRGFRPNATILFDGLNEPCEMITYTSTLIQCRTPGAPIFYSKAPTSSPSSLPSSIPSSVPSSEPSSIPTIVPSSLPSESPSAQPSSIPSQIPSSEPSAIPSQIPSSLPTLSPNARPTSLPSTHPSGKPSQIPSSKPSSHPSSQPTSQPSHPTFQPTVKPSFEPTVVPSVQPSYEPSIAPTVKPSYEPSIAPSVDPTFHPTVAPSAIPTIFPTGSNSTHRRLLTNILENQYTISVDETTPTDFNMTYTYRIEDTPLIDSITPVFVSSAISYNISIVGSMLNFDNTTVYIGDELCSINYSNLVNETLHCLLPRNKTFGALRDVSVKIQSPSVGYAALRADFVSLPEVSRGFGLSGISPRVGSLMGGNRLTVHGSGFLADAPSRHTVTLNQIGADGLSEYDTLLLALGFSITTEIPAQYTLYCNVTWVNSTMLVCDLPIHDDLYTDADYSVSVTLNNVTSVCSDYEYNCTYSQATEFTPTLTSATIVNSTSQGTYELSLLGDKLSFGELSVTIYDEPCQIIDVSSSSALIESPSIPHGHRLVQGSVEGLGAIYSTAFFDASSAIYSIEFASTNGSIAGGTEVEIHGYGFSHICDENNVTFVAIHGTTPYPLLATQFIECSTTSMKLYTPSLLTSVSSSLLRVNEFSANIASITFSTFNVSDNLQTKYFAETPFFYSVKSTPTVTVNATSSVAGNVINILTNAPSDETTIDVKIGSVSCDHLHISTLSTTSASVNCVFPQISAQSSKYSIFTMVSPYGFAIDTSSSYVKIPSITSTFSVDSFGQNILASVIGGLDMTITGHGFSSLTNVTVCGLTCNISSAVTYSSLTCSIPSLTTTKSIEYWDSNDINIDLIDTVNGTYFGSYSNSKYLTNVHDSNYTTSYYHYSSSCYVGVDLPTGYVARPYRMRFYPTIKAAQYFTSMAFEGKIYGTSSYVTLATSTGAHEGWNYLSASNYTTSWFSSFRYKAIETTTKSACRLAEVEFLGTVASTSDTCTVSVSNGYDSFSYSIGKVKYEVNTTATPYLAAVTPNNGSALGGETVMLQGVGFTPKFGAVGEVSVSFSGVNCAIVNYTDSQITCITGERKPEDIEISNIKINIPGKGLAAMSDDVSYLYIDKWSALTSWLNQEPPVDGDIVWIPDGQVILLDENTPLLLFLLIEGRLYFDRSKDLTVDSNYIYVKGGYLEIGTEEEPFEKHVTITIHGDRYKSIEIPFMGAKFMTVSSRNVIQDMTDTVGKHMVSRDQGIIEIHGQKRLRTWTKVNTTAYQGTNYLITSEPVDFQPGEKLILTGNEQPGVNGGNDYEELIVLSNVDNHNITFTTALKYTHRSEIIVIEGRTLDLRCEIGLLSRNVIIQGDNDKSNGQLMGVHTMAFVSGIYRIENAEIRRCGQSFNFGRYCTHSHMGHMMEGSYVKANSIHHSFQRAVTTHYTTDWEVRDNVAFEIQGHAFFVEDGDEQRNSITGNLGVKIRRSSALLKSDQKPAIFWMSTPANYWRDNVAAHSAMFGYWFELVGTMNGLCPVHMSIGEFRNNTAHSNGDIGLRIYPEWTPFADPCSTDSSPASTPQYLHNTLSYRNGGNGIFSKRHGDIHHISPSLIENGGPELAIVHFQNVPYDVDPFVYNGLFVGTTDKDFRDSTNLGKFGIFGPQGEYFYVKNTTFVNYGSSGAITGCNECLVGSEMNQGGFTARYEDIRFVDSPLRFYWSPTKKEILWDLDGSLAGVPDSMITVDYDHLHFDDVCEVLSPLSIYSTSIRCGGNGTTARIRRMQMESVEPYTSLDYTDINVKSSQGTGTFYFLPLDTLGWVFPVVTGANKSYTFAWDDAGISATQFKLTLGRDAYLLETKDDPTYDETVRITYSPQLWDYDPYSFAITYNDITRYAARNNTRFLTNMGEAEYKNRTLEVVITNKNAVTTASPAFGLLASSRLCPPTGCPVPPEPTIDSPMLWSNTTSWTAKRLPRAGEKVTINSNMWIVMDISPPKLGCIVVYGKLSMYNNDTHPMNLTLNAQCIQVFGILEIIGNNTQIVNNTLVANYNASTDTPYNGNVTIIISGTKGSSLPVTMGEGRYLGSKVIAVSGSMKVVGQPVSHTWVRLKETVNHGSNVLSLAQAVNWTVDSELVLSPTAFYSHTGASWSSTKGLGTSDEVRIIQNISTVYDAITSEPYTQIILNRPLNHTHLCETVDGEIYCGAVGLLTRSIRFISGDSESSKTSSYGFGGHLHVTDLTSTTGSLQLVNVELKNFGKINSDKYAVTVGFTRNGNFNTTITNCSFNAGYNLAMRASYAVGLYFDNNVVFGTWGGGVYIESTIEGYSVNRNLFVGTRQLPSVLLSSYPWVRPVASLSLYSINGTAINNLFAGSEDEGLAATMSFFHTSTYSMPNYCQLTRGTTYDQSGLSSFQHPHFYNNEAVACRSGFVMVTSSSSESQEAECAIFSHVKSWRNGHHGLFGADIKPNLLIHNVSLAENHIGIDLHVYRGGATVFTGVVNSIVRNSLGRNGNCSDLSDSLYIRGKQCNVSTEEDPLGLSTSCNSIIADLYRRVGLMIPQFTNAPRTCAIAGRFTPCDPPNTPDRLCEMSWNARYGLPIDIVYAEYHIHNVEFIGFQSREYANNISSYANQCIPNSQEDHSYAIVTNPTQSDMQPTLITSELSFNDNDLNARIAFETLDPADTCGDHPCSGQNMMIIHDLDGSLADHETSGQLYITNPDYLAPYPLCYELSEIATNLFFCPSTVEGEEGFKQYAGLWRDWGPQIIQPIITTRTYDDINRTFASYGPFDDMCAKRFYFSRFNMLFAKNTINYVRSTGTAPNEWIIRWDAPSEEDVTIIEFFIETSQVVNVYVSDNADYGFVNVPKSSVYPNFTSPAGTNLRDPQKRILAVTLRGGANRYYKFVQVPVAAVTIKMDMDLADFYADTFIANIALLLGIPVSRIKITSVRRGSVIADFEVSPSVSVANDTSGLLNQISELNEVTANLTQAVVTGTIETYLNVTIQQVFAVPPVVPVVLDETMEIASNSTFNITEYRSSLIEVNTASVVVIYTYPTSLPTGQPSSQPSGQPSSQPTSVPSNQPSSQPSMVPSSQPTSAPSSQPSSFPTSKPSSQPSTQPTSQPTQPTSLPTNQPTGQPSQKPSSQPTRVPTSQPSSQPTRQPTGQPSRQPTAQPSKRPSGQPTSQPTRQPTSQPTSKPSRQPTSKPSMQPSSQPTSHPSGQPSGQPTGQPSCQPTSRPSSQPSSQPTGKPSSQPTSFPSSQPSSRPTSKPSSQPSSVPSVIPTSKPTSLPSSHPSSRPSVVPSSLPTSLPTSLPSSRPSAAPTSIPTTRPSSVPTSEPSSLPSADPTTNPSAHPSFAPTSQPSAKPTIWLNKPTSHPSSVPSTHPTHKPTPFPSTQSPTVAPSTRAPTTATYTQLSFACTQTLQSCSADDFKNSTSAQETFIETVKTNIPSSQLENSEIAITNITDVSVSVRRILTSTSSAVQIVYNIILIYDTGKSISASILYNTFTNNLKAVILNGTFVDNLVQSGLPLFASVNTSISSLVVQNFTVTNVDHTIPDPVNSSDKSNNSTKYVIIGVVVSVVAVLAFFGYYIYILRIKLKNSRNLKVAPLKPDYYNGYTDIERLNSPDLILGQNQNQLGAFFIFPDAQRNNNNVVLPRPEDFHTVIPEEHHHHHRDHDAQLTDPLPQQPKTWSSPSRDQHDATSPEGPNNETPSLQGRYVAQDYYRSTLISSSPSTATPGQPPEA